MEETRLPSPPSNPRAPASKSRVKLLHPALWGLLGFLIIWQTLLVIFEWAPYLVPGPIQVLETFWEERGSLLRASWQTSAQALLGLGMAFMVSLALAFFLILFQTLQRIVLPLASFFQTVPVVAIAPLLVIWFGFGAPTVRASSALVSFFPLLANILSGLNSASPNQLDLFRVYGARPWQIFWKLRLPSSMRQVFVGLRIGSGLAVVGAIVGEFIAGGGLGSLIDSARTQQRVDLVFASVLLSSIVGWIFILLIERISAIWEE